MIDFIKTLWLAYRYSKGELASELYQDNAALRLCKIVKKAKPIIRNLIAKGLKEHRYFEVDQEWAEAKKFYEDYFQNNPTVFKNRSEIEIGSWVTVIGHEEPIKGDRYAEYHTNWYGTKPGTYRVKSYSSYDDKSVDLYNVTMDVTYLMMRPATEAEISAAKALYISEMDDRKQSINKSFQRQIDSINEDYQWLKAS